MHIRCPHCNNPVEILDDTPFDALSCPSCESRFNLTESESTKPYMGGESSTVGHFELLDHVGSGHFGNVWKARDAELDRIVAIKIPRKEQLEPHEAEQFLREARAAAQVRHPNIVPVHEVGREEDTFYIVTDYIDGASLQEWSSTHRLGFQEVAELCVKLAEGLHVAHEAGVIHRDLKPGNIMMDRSGEPYIADFGLARREAGEITMTVDGQILGTPAYMSPEQAIGKGHEADRRSDVYSLGVILYELLTGEKPFRGEKRMLILQILDDDPPLARKLKASIPRDLETICLKCLEKEQQNRYRSSQELAEELKRFLNGEAIVARPISRFGKLLRWTKRKPAVASLSAAVVLTLLGGATVSTYFAIETSAALGDANSANEKKDEALQAKSAALEEKDIALRDHQRTIDSYVTTVKNAELLKEKRFKPLLKKLLKDAQEHYRQFIQKQADEQDPESLQRMARALFEIGWISNASGSKQDAITAFLKSRDIRKQLVRNYPNVLMYRNNLASVHNNLGTLYHDTTQLTEAMAEYRKAFEIWENLAREKPEVTQYRNDMTTGYNHFGDLYRQTGKPDKALSVYRKALAIQEELVAEYPEFPEYLSDLAHSYNKIGLVHRNTRNPVEAIIAHRQALRIRECLVCEDPSVDLYRRDLADSYNNVAAFHYENGKYEEALDPYQSALQIRERLARENPTITDYQNDLATIHNNLGVLYRETGRLNESLKSYRQSQKIQERMVRENPTITNYRSTLAMSHNNLGKLYRQIGKMDEALTEFRQALTIRERLARDHTTVMRYQNNLAKSYDSLGIFYQGIGKSVEASNSYIQGQKILKQLVQENPTVNEFRSDLARSHNNLGALYGSTGKLTETLDQFQEALKIRKQLVRDNPTALIFRSDLVSSHNNLGNVYFQIGRLNKALTEINTSLKIGELLVRENPKVIEFRINLAMSQNALGVIHRRSGKPVDALKAYRSALKIRKQLADENPSVTEYQVDLAGSLVNLALLTGTQEPRNAIDLLGRSMQLLKLVSNKEPKNPTVKSILTKALLKRARLFDDRKEFQDAAADYRELVKLHAGQSRLGYEISLSRSLALGGDYKQAVALADRLAADKQNSSTFYNIGCVYSLAALASQSDSSLKTEEKKTLTEKHAQQAIAMLKRAAASEFFRNPQNVELLRSDEDLESLREHREFKKLLKKITQSSKSKLQKQKKSQKQTGDNKNTNELLFE